jgi:hypothetical protein
MLACEASRGIARKLGCHVEDTSQPNWERKINFSGSFAEKRCVGSAWRSVWQLLVSGHPQINRLVRLQI